jgi:hypothetical protein
MEARDVSLCRELVAAAEPGTCTVPSAVFQSVLAAQGLRFGTPACDRVMGLCDMVGLTGVTIDRYVDAVKRSAPSLVGGPLLPEFEAASKPKSSYSFLRHLAAATGSPGRQQQPAPLGLGHADIHLLTPAISACYAAFDSGMIAEDVFRQKMVEIGVPDSTAIDKLLRGGAFSLAKLLQALTTLTGGRANAPQACAGGAPSGPVPAAFRFNKDEPSQPRSVKGAAPRVGVRETETDVISWRKGTQGGDGLQQMHTGRGKGAFHKDYNVAHELDAP